MRQSSLFVLLALILLFAFFGWKALGIVLLLVLLAPILLIVAGFAILWWLRRRVTTAAKHFQENLQQGAQAPSPPTNSRPEAIDVQGQLKDEEGR